MAVSGGPDSLALLLLANAAYPGGVEAASVDHGLRTESESESDFVARLCSGLGIPHETLKVEVAAGNVQAKAREARYRALSAWTSRRGLGALATAHHADDQAETLLMRLNRGSGLAGLAGVRAWSWGHSIDPPGEFELVRPLLGWRKAELEEVVRMSGVIPVRDPSNQNEEFDRVRMRAALAGQHWLDPVAIAKSAGLLGEMLHDLERILARQRRSYVIEQDDGIVYLWGHGKTLEIENVRWIIGQLGGDASRSDIAAMIERLKRKQNASLAGVLGRVVMHPTGANSSTEAWKFEPEPPRKTG
ncbi:tRNA lysidine(34) synthetase TilS [Pontixanthobacter aquaemixtae]|uniref:tRNA(Ile)-lysidine synthase n=1 Tax=Pontixanthobacter aquaemixtae TaxID=1958940 RepID=A0A844ZLV8_9SPHN|nr:tRNA lysidine(34) synthetase TilS [Pontixanthobacter aquaemixtae]MXO89391.1 tRNA lysidine(34) synthetase TilS [Pontixanthobacter aquaemixtae]